MSYVHPFSKCCEKSEVDLFSVPPTQQSLERGRWIDYAPLSSVENPDSAINFLIAGTDEYIDLSKTILTVEGIITKGNGKDPLSGSGQSSVAPVNNFLHSLFKQVDVYLNGKQVTPAMGTYAYRSYIETLLNYDVSAKESQFSSAMYFKDTAHFMDATGSSPSTKTITYVTNSPNNGDTEVVIYRWFGDRSTRPAWTPRSVWTLRGVPESVTSFSKIVYIFQKPYKMFKIYIFQKPYKMFKTCIHFFNNCI